MEWARKAGEEIPDLSGADLGDADLSGADLSGADLSGADLQRCRPPRADLSDANLSGADLSGANLSDADLTVPTSACRPQRCRPQRCRPQRCRPRRCRPQRCQPRWAACGGPYSPTSICPVPRVSRQSDITAQARSADTLSARRKDPEAVLRGCGMPEYLIANQKALIGSMEPIQFYSCFISHSSRTRIRQSSLLSHGPGKTPRLVSRPRICEGAEETSSDRRGHPCSRQASAGVIQSQHDQ